MMNDEKIEGYFVVLNEEEKQEIARAMKLNNGRAGVFKEKKELISTLQKHESLNKEKMHVIEVSVPPSCITNLNCTKFGIKCAQGVTVTKIESFSEAMRGIEIR
jgi:hypothetical protein